LWWWWYVYGLGWWVSAVCDDELGVGGGWVGSVVGLVSLRVVF
jgi:hypothetical protein